MHELSVDSEVTFRKVLGSAEILPTRPGIDPFKDTRPMDTPSDRSSLQLTPLTSVSPSVIAPGTAPGLASSTHTSTPEPLHMYMHDLARLGGVSVCPSVNHTLVLRQNYNNRKIMRFTPFGSPGNLVFETKFYLYHMV